MSVSNWSHGSQRRVPDCPAELHILFSWHFPLVLCGLGVHGRQSRISYQTLLGQLFSGISINVPPSGADTIPFRSWKTPALRDRLGACAEQVAGTAENLSL